MEQHQKEFQTIKNALKKKGYHERNVTFTPLKVNILSLIYSIPFLIVLTAVYRLFLIDRAHLAAITGPSFYLTFLGVAIVFIVIHELLHGVGWCLSSGKGWQTVRFNINAIMPSCACKTPLKKKQYLVGVLLPLSVLGLISTIFLFVYPGTLSILTIFINFTSAGGDLIIAANVLKERNSLIVDHPVEAGYIAFYK